MIKVALTGNIGSGKSTVCRIFSAMNIPVFIADQEAKLLYKEESVKVLVKNAFGDEVFYMDGEVDFEALANVIFNDKEALKTINGIIHPLTIDRYNEWLIKNHEADYTIHESAILFENNLQDHFDKLINVTAPIKLRLKRVSDRDKLPVDKIRDRMMNQMTEKEKNELADFVIINDGEHFLIPQVVDINKQIRNK